MFRKKKKNNTEQGSCIYIDEDATYDNAAIEKGSGDYIEGFPSDQANYTGEPSGYYEKGTNKKKRKDENLIT